MNVKLLSLLKLVFCVFAICFSQLLVGCSCVFSSTLLAQLREPGSTIQLSNDEASWVASISVLVCPIGLIITGILTDKIGRKNAILITFIPMIISWLILVFANSYRAILIARIIQGYPFGSGTCDYVYIAETSPVKLRPIFFSTVTLFTGFGILAEWLFAAYFHWNTVAAMLCVISVVGFILVLLVPESPMWLRAHGRYDEADKVDKWFGFTMPAAGDDDERAVVGCNTAVANVVTGPLCTAAAAVAVRDGLRGHDSCGDEPTRNSTVVHNHNNDNNNNNNNNNNNVDNCWRMYAHRTVWRPTVVTSTFMCLQQCSGVYVLLFYSVDVFRDCGIRADGVTVSVFLALARVIGGIVFAFLYRVQRKTLILVSGLCTAASLSVIVAYMRAFEGAASPPYGFVPVAAFVWFMFFQLLGVLPLPWMLCGEVFPMAVKGTMSGAVQTWGYFVMFLVIKIYPFLVSSFGVQIVWSIFATGCVLNTLFGIFVMPETKGKSLDDIISYFDGRKNKLATPIIILK